MKKGFTLIELLAVIVILAIIATIAAPIVLDIIKDTKKSAQIESAKFYINAVEQSIALSKLNNQSKENATYQIMGNGNLCEGTIENNACIGNEIEVEVKGEVPKTGSIALKNGDMSLAISNGEYCIIKSFSDSNITVYDNGNSCLLPGTAVVSGESQLTLYNSNGQNLTNYKIYGNSVQGKLPSEYQQVEYIESTGTQYIDTGVYGNQNTRITTVIQQIENNGSWQVWLGALKESVDGNWIHLGQASSNRGLRFAWGVDMYNVHYTNIAYDDFSKHSYDIDKGKITIDNDYSFTFKFENFSTGSTTITLFADNVGNTIKEYAQIRVFECKMYDNDKLIRNLIPCYRKSDNVIGMYDLVNDKFYTNAGSGTFVKGNDAPTPESPVEIESVGEKTKNLSNVGSLTFERYMSITPKEPIPAGTYTFSSIIHSTDVDGNTSAVIFVGINGEKTVLFMPRSVAGERVSETFIVDYTISNILFYASDNYVNGTEDTVSYNDIQIEEGENATEYEPYGYKIPIKISNDSETITTNIYLKEPLRKIGDYADYIDFETGKVVRNVGELKLNGTEYWEKGNFSSDKVWFRWWNTSFIKDTSVLSTRFLNKIYWDLPVFDCNGIAINPTTSYLYISDNTLTDDLTEFKTWLSKNNTTITYPLSTPTEEVIELPNIPTFKGTTIIEVDASINPSNVEITY